MDFFNSIEQLPLATWVRESGTIWAYPTVLCLHIVGMGMVAGLSSFINLRLLGLWTMIPVKPLERLFTWIWWGFWLNAVTGTILLLADATTKLRNPDFYIKMVFIFIGVIVLRRMRTTVFASPLLMQGTLPGGAKGLAWVSLVCWLAAIITGRLLAYVGPVAGIAAR
jgi:hypothetical protein